MTRKPLKTDDAIARVKAQKQAESLAIVGRVIIAIEALPDDRQQHIYDCALRFRALCCEFGPDSKLAIALTSSELAAGIIQIEPGLPIELPTRRLILPH